VILVMENFGTYRGFSFWFDWPPPLFNRVNVLSTQHFLWKSRL
jgi:hypothetical protein